MRADTEIGVCPFGCNSDTDDGKVEFSATRQIEERNDEVTAAAQFYTCTCCHIAFSVYEESIKGLDAEDAILRDRLKIDSN